MQFNVLFLNISHDFVLGHVPGPGLGPRQKLVPVLGPGTGLGLGPCPVIFLVPALVLVPVIISIPITQ